MARPKLKEDERKVSVSFALDAYWHTILLEEIPPGQRSGWLCEVVKGALKEFKELASSDLV